jgi:hypothetical protein
MKKILILSSITFLLLTISLMSNQTSAVLIAEYLTYPELIMESGKLSRDFTSEEYDKYLEGTYTNWMFGIAVNIVNKNVRTSYISDVIYSYTNNSNTDIKYTLDIQKETKKTCSFQTSASVGGSASGNINKIKAEVSAKANVDYATTEVQSEKVTQKYDVVIEAHSNIIVFLEGHLLITNGVLSIYDFWIRTSGSFELAILQDQSIRVEKSSI